MSFWSNFFFMSSWSDFSPLSSWSDSDRIPKKKRRDSITSLALHSRMTVCGRFFPFVILERFFSLCHSGAVGDRIQKKKRRDSIIPLALHSRMTVCGRACAPFQNDSAIYFTFFKVGTTNKPNGSISLYTDSTSRLTVASVLYK